ncbi:translation elongation factor 4 [Candidatus Palauibacter sp.]|uniref:translation elongation factor 4 n=1 Tax=Candidatus Palauibacter sp. TaxID=3101350 RepID=UPI003B01EA92
MSAPRIRNFSIIAHIDHGKSTLADRLLERTGTVDPRRMRKQVLDSMELERERGITIKLNAIRMSYRHRGGDAYQLNLIDTPGHVDFTYEVSRSLAACEGALLVVDATQGIEAQTLANLFLAVEADLEVVPVINKIDLPAADPERVSEEVSELLGVDPAAAIHASAKEGEGIEAVLDAIVERIPPPGGDPDAPLRALIFDSQYDRYRGAMPILRVVDGQLREGMRIGFGRHDAVYEVDEAGFMRLGFESTGSLGCGEVGYLTAQIKNVGHTRVGDTVLDADDRAPDVLPGYREAKSMVFAGLYPTDSDDFEELREALEKLQLNDASLHYEPETSDALGFGFRCGFLGLLHMEIVQERLEREFGVDLITTLPSVEYEVTLTNGEEIRLENPSKMPERVHISEVREPFVQIRIVSPADYIGAIQRICHDRRGRYVDLQYLDPSRVEIAYSMPLGEIVLDFYDKLKSVSRGYASLDYDISGHEPSDLVKLDILLNGDPVDALSVIVHRSRAYTFGQKMARKLKELIPRQLFDVAIQAAIGRDVIARTTVKALRKNVTAKCYGGDITRKRKLLEKQREGKRRMKQVGSVEVPQEAFLAVLQVDSD